MNPKVLVCLISLPAAFASCDWYNDKDNASVDASRLEPLVGQRKYICDAAAQVTYCYYVGICVSGEPYPQYPSAGVVQHINIVATSKVEFIPVGNYTKSMLYQGTDWLMLRYDGGRPYKSHCGGNERSAIIMITCDKSVSKFDVDIVAEDRYKKDGCSYLFSIKHRAACSPPPAGQHALSVGTILILLFFSGSVAYLIGGLLYQRLVNKARGFEQIPNYHFWRKVGSYAADGCDKVCRCGQPSKDEEPVIRDQQAPDSTQPTQQAPRAYTDDPLLM